MQKNKKRPAPALPGAELRTWLEVDKKAIAHNFRVFKKLISKKTQLLGVIKSNAYGHNLLEFGVELEKLGVDWLGVDSLIEGLSVRLERVKTPILVLGHTLPELFDTARDARISITVSNFTTLLSVLKKGKNKTPLRIHIKIDTGMHRQGFQAHEMKQLIDLLSSKKDPSFVIEGLYTHFAEAKNPRSGDNTRRQLHEFEKWVKAFRDAGFTPIVHASATGAALLYPSAHFDMVRIGIGMYGLWPSDEAERFLSQRIALKPVLSWKAIISEIKQVKSGERIGYDLTEMLTRESKIAVIPIGYWHGFPRMLSSRGRVLVHGKSARVLGRVSMDMIVVDVTDLADVHEGDVATLIGRDGKEEIFAKEIARLSATTHYEIVTRLNPLMKKFYR